MGRKYVPRTSFGPDVVFLTRLIESVRCDPKLPSDYKRKLIEDVGTLVTTLQLRDSVVIETE